jgi:acetoacetate decarboxylase
MRETEARERAFATPLTNPAYPPGPYRFINREFLVITYPAKLRDARPRQGRGRLSAMTG